MIRALLLALVAFLAVQPAAAQQLRAKQLTALDPAKAYIFYRTQARLNIRFLQTPDEAETAAYAKRRAEALARARAKYAQAGDAKTAREPTDATLDFAPIAVEHLLLVSGQRPFDKGSQAYVIAVRPGTYTLYGYFGIAANTQLSACMCMGSVRFDAPGGVITDLGEIRMPEIEELLAEQGPMGLAFEGMAVQPELTTMTLAPATPAMEVPAALTGMPIRAAELRAAPKLPNYLGVLIDRLAPIAGVLAYARDKVIDARSGELAAP
jgi:hypothetical protein